MDGAPHLFREIILSFLYPLHEHLLVKHLQKTISGNQCCKITSQLFKQHITVPSLQGMHTLFSHTYLTRFAILSFFPSTISPTFTVEGRVTRQHDVTAKTKQSRKHHGSFRSLLRIIDFSQFGHFANLQNDSQTPQVTSFVICCGLSLESIHNFRSHVFS